MLQTIICSTELDKDELIHDKLQAWVDQGLQLVLLPCKPQEWQNLKLEDCLWIVTTDEEWELGRQQNIAMLPYVPQLELLGDWDFTRKPEVLRIPSFPKAENIISGFESVDYEYLERIYRREHHLPWIIAETDEFVLREFVMTDLDDLFVLYEDSTLYPFVEPLFDREHEAEYEQQYIANMYHLLGYGMWLLYDKKSARLMGRAGLESHDYGDVTGLELGYLIHRDFRGKGLATRVCQVIIDYARRELNYDTLYCVIHRENRASIHLAEKLGMVYDKTIVDHGKEMLRYCMKL